MRLIVKVQRPPSCTPGFGFGLEKHVVIYDKNQRRKTEGLHPAALAAFGPEEHKFFCYAEWDGSKFTLLERAPWQEW